MKRHIELLDTSIILPLLGVPSKDQHRSAVEQGIDSRSAHGIQLLLPVATILESGARVGETGDGSARRSCAMRFRKLIQSTLDREAPWSFQALHWDDELIGRLVAADNGQEELVECFASRYLQMGDLVIVQEFRRLRANLSSRYADIDVWTFDTNLRAVIDHIRSASP
jgi:hypothetical protein